MSGVVRDSPDNDFHFTTSKGESFAMSPTEVADAMAFVRKLKAKAEKEVSRTCPHCDSKWYGNVESDTTAMNNKCTSCGGVWYRHE